ncbi:MAG: HAD family hydrolase [Nitratiruptor sp.]|nr:HAD family hydrolase [Nitratiruptor sp.]NPA83441.1 HAD-IIA family hydrolase [Campylobacterota bacterium]
MIYFIDVQGTLIDDYKRRPIPGAIDFLQELQARDIPYILITNNTKEPSQRFLTYLQELGFPVDEKRYIDPLMVLNQVLPTRRIAAYGVPGFLQTLTQLGYQLTWSHPEAVVLSVKEDYSFQEFAAINEYLLQGAKLVGMHGTSLYAKGGRRYPGVGALLAMLEFATGVKGEVVGKPSPLFYTKALERVGGERFDQVVIVSDDARGDLAGAKALGMETVLVLTGKVKSSDELHLDWRPDRIVPSIAQLKEGPWD